MTQEINIYLVHHSADMDGLTSGVIGEAYFENFLNQIPYEYSKNINYKSCSFDYYDDESKFTKLIDKPTILIFVDVLPSSKFFESIKNNNSIYTMVYDHHMNKDLEVSEIYGLKTDSVKSIVHNYGIASLNGPTINMNIGGNCAAKVFFDSICFSDFTFRFFTALNKIGFTNQPIPTELFNRPYRKLPVHYALIDAYKRITTTYLDEFAAKYNQFVDMDNLYDIWLWEDIVKNEKQKVNGSDRYNLYKMFKGEELTNHQINIAIDGYAYNYFANRFAKQIREIDLFQYLQLTKLFVPGISMDHIEKRLASIPRFEFDRPTAVFKDILHRFLERQNFTEWIDQGVYWYIKDYEEVADFFSYQTNRESIIKEYDDFGHKYLIVNYEFSNIIRDYLYNTYDGISFVLFTRTLKDDRNKLKITGRTLVKGSFPVNELMKQEFNGGGHLDAGGGTFDRISQTSIEDKIYNFMLNNNNI